LGRQEGPLQGRVGLCRRDKNRDPGRDQARSVSVEEKNIA
jgi:hypothetical protein